MKSTSRPKRNVGKQTRVSRIPSERELISFLGRLSSGSDSSAARAVKVVRGIGDDAAVLATAAGNDLLVTTDLFVEGVHFRRDWMTAQQAGRRALGRAASDIAAMGGRAEVAFLSAAYPENLPATWAKGFLRGFCAAAQSLRIRLVGGDTGSGAVFLADVVVIGSAPRGTAVLRSGARPGDGLFVSGRLGATAAALAAGKPLPLAIPRLALGWFLRENKLASAMTDVSDGLSTDASHIAEESGVAIEIEAEKLPLAGTLEQALNGGEDYELLFTVPPGRAAFLGSTVEAVPVWRVGSVISGSGLWIREGARRRRLRPSGWEHFKRIDSFSH